MRSRRVVVGASQGGLAALRVLLAALPARFSAALIIVLHRGQEETGGLLPLLHPCCILPVGFPLDKEPIAPGQVYVAPPNYHLLVEDDHFAFSLDAPENFLRPSSDVLFESAAEVGGAGLTGIVLTGTGCDGARGLAAIHRQRGIVQTPAEAAAPEMPRAALAATPGAWQMTLREIGNYLARMTQH